jgi:hypothetical protein
MNASPPKREHCGRRVVLPTLARRPLLGEAVAAVDGPVLAGLERDAGGATATGADGLEHLAGAAVAATTAATAVAPGLSTGRTALGVLVAATGVELLVVDAEGKLGAALGTGKGTVLVGHSMTSFLSPSVKVWSSSSERFLAGSRRAELQPRLEHLRAASVGRHVIEDTNHHDNGSTAVKGQGRSGPELAARALAL